MAVRSYYCAKCGIKLTPDQARCGRASIESLTTHCPSCAEELGIELLRDPPPLPGSTSGRLPPAAAPGPGPALLTRPAKDLVFDPTPRRATRTPLVVVACIAVAAILAALGLLNGGDDAASAAPPPPREAAVELKPPAEPAAAKNSSVSPKPLPNATPTVNPPPAPIPPKPTAADPLPARISEPKPAAASAGASTRASTGSTPPADLPPGWLLGNERSKKLHKPDCKWAQKISPENRVAIRDAADAKKLGFEPCKECLR